MSSSIRNEIEIKLFNQQAYPIAGPVLFSPLVAIASVVQMLFGSALFLIGKVKETISGSSNELWKAGQWHLKDGGIDLAYSLLNTCSLGIMGGVCYLIAESIVLVG